MGVYRRKEWGTGRLGKVWWISYVVAGRQKRESSGSTNKRVAQKLLAIRQAQVFEGRLQLPASKPPKFEKWAEKFLASVPHPTTKKRYEYSIQALSEHFANARLSQITPDLIEQFKEERLSSSVRAATVNRDLAVLRRMLNLAKKRRLIAQNPFAEVEFLEERKQRRQPHILTFQEQDRLLAAASPRLRVLMILLTETGLRVNKEALQLRWGTSIWRIMYCMSVIQRRRREGGRHRSQTCARKSWKSGTSLLDRYWSFFMTICLLPF